MSEEQEKPQVGNEKLEKLSEALDGEKKRSEEYLTRLKYMQADFENLKKRFDRQREEVKNYCNERLIVQLLDIVDELEMAVKSGHSSKSADVVTQGVEMTLKKLNKILESEGVTPLECVGKIFDPSKHDVVATVEKDDVEGCVMVEEVRKGYIMKGKLIRPSIVKVAVKSSKSQQEVTANE
jgi:molecular chaperone GrpE